MFLWRTGESVRFVVNSVASDAGQVQTGYEAFGGTEGYEIFKTHSSEEIGETASRRAISLLQADPAPAGKMPVVMAAEAGGTMVHEACGHGLEADLVQKKLSVYSGKLEQNVASPLVTVVDDATIKGNTAPCALTMKKRPEKVLIDSEV